jgi:hypothetical protein
MAAPALAKANTAYGIGKYGMFAADNDAAET